MLPLPIFDYHRPDTLEDATALLAALGDKARVIAGGTDVLPNMKHGLFEPEHVVSVSRLAELRGVSVVGGGRDDGAHPALHVGAGNRLAEIADSLTVRRLAPALAEACGLVGGPHHRAMGTLGGNVCLDTRCRYYNQTYFWRSALGFCLKKDGTVCHVVKGGKRCVAAASNDSAPALMALDASIHLLSSRGARVVKAVDFYVADGVKNSVIEPDELVVRVSVPIVEGRASAFEKLRRRGAIDFPLLSVAARVDREPAPPDADDHAFDVKAVEVVVSALGARPRRIRAAENVPHGESPSRIVEGVAAAAYAECKPLTNLDDDAEWRREMVPVFVRRALTRALAAHQNTPHSSGQLL
jgi:4-hydroxybenzoyl-CoA reductase subunit beta